MDTFETSTQSFIVKIWVEEPSPGEVDVSWCGHITHVISGERFCFESLEQIREIMDLFLEEGHPLNSSNSCKNCK